LPAGTATLRIRQELFSAGEIREKHEAILQMLSDVPTYELHYSDLHDAMRKLDLLRETYEPAPRPSAGTAQLRTSNNAELVRQLKL
jgi:hypothetical protein